MAMKEIDFEGFNLYVKRKLRVNNPEFDKELLKFVLERKSDELSEDLVLEKSDRLRVSHDIKDHDINISKGWLQSFKKRKNIKSCALTGESGSLCIEDVQAAKAEIRSLIEQYCPSDVFNFDETVLFYDLPPDKTLSTVWNNGK